MRIFEVKLDQSFEFFILNNSLINTQLANSLLAYLFFINTATSSHCFSVVRNMATE
jgi:hypothetical protein